VKGAKLTLSNNTFLLPRLAAALFSKWLRTRNATTKPFASHVAAEKFFELFWLANKEIKETKTMDGPK
jgi:hypothetical protein